MVMCDAQGYLASDGRDSVTFGLLDFPHCILFCCVIQYELESPAVSPNTEGGFPGSRAWRSLSRHSGGSVDLDSTWTWSVALSLSGWWNGRGPREGTQELWGRAGEMLA